MNIPDEYFNSDTPSPEHFYAVRANNGVTYACDGRLARDFYTTIKDVRFCRLAPAAEVERLKAENEKLRGWLADAYGEGWRDGSVSMGRDPTGDWGASTARARLEGRAE